MGAINSKALSVNPWIVEVAQYVSTLPVLLADNSNAVAVKSALDALTYVRVSSVTDVKVSENYGDNKVEIITDDNGTVYKSVAPSVTISGNWYEIWDVDSINAMVGKTILSVAWTPVTITDEAKGTGWTVGQPIKLNNKNWANTAVTITNVKAWASTLVANTDYKSYVADGTNGQKGYTYIVPLTAQASAITSTYQYTPNASKYTWMTIKNIQIPKLVVRITSTDCTTNKVKVNYLVDSWFDWELIQSFVDVARAWEIANAPFNFTGNRNGQVLSYTDDL